MGLVEHTVRPKQQDGRFSNMEESPFLYSASLTEFVHLFLLI